MSHLKCLGILDSVAIMILLKRFVWEFSELGDKEPCSSQQIVNF